ncbi:GHKL domain-containing protein [Bacillus luteolus]|uniref:histidine kinase n=1 Tax=Litchfieldia luteola TaxID=682179 RepID=A0ABR9QG98_9BACI|nr:histidine kinase N-terminal domain-containing protein [Cytobacillus luteolus]MBE4907527.1 GHKL domain-containing protein [Cytobacillus luteolus]MBP1944296.1 signal transduction histidine kinase [Cytobacillus luteolus]
MKSISKQYNIETIIKFLENRETEFIEEWYKSTLTDEKDFNKEKVKLNGLHMYGIIKKAIRSSFCPKEVREFAYKVAEERLESNTNIGEFVFNVNTGRSIIIKYVLLSELPIIELQMIINEINDLFDQFCYHAVSRYTDLKDKQIEEKNLFINEIHNDKLAVLGQMSSSFVHEFRNPLTSIIGFTKILKNENPNLKYLDIIEHELNQLKFRITQFLHTSKIEVNGHHKENFQVSTLFEEILQLTYPSIVDNDVNIISNLDKEIFIDANKEELKQVLLNIIINSIDALREKEKPRKLTVSTFLESNKNIIQISNNGPEIPPASLNTIFEPFYTTKQLGTGIGLYVCKKIIENHHGIITCQSNKELTTFRISLPI